MQRSLHKWNEETVASSFPSRFERVFPELPRDDSRGQEEDQFLRRCAHAGPLEKVPD